MSSQLTVILGGGAGMVLARQAEFVRAFVRPRGLDTAATPLLADGIEHLPQDARGLAVQRPTTSLAALALRVLLGLQRMPGTRRLFLDEREVRRDANLKENRRRRRAEAFARKAEQRAEKAARAGSVLVKILFLVRHYAYLRLFESSIAGLAERGHEVHLAAHREEAMGGRQLAEAIAARYPGVTLGTAPARARRCMA